MIAAAVCYACNTPGACESFTQSEQDTLDRFKDSMIKRIGKYPLAGLPQRDKMIEALRNCPLHCKFTSGGSVDGDDGTSNTVKLGPLCPNRVRVALANDFFSRNDKCAMMYTLLKECYRRAYLSDYDDTGLSDNRADADFRAIQNALLCRGHR